MRAVHVIWIDSHTEIGWDAYRAEHTEPDLTHTVGVMIDETENYAILAHSYDPASNEWNGRISIPLQAIKEIRTLCRIKTK